MTPNERAAQIWCKPYMSSKEMDTELCSLIAAEIRAAVEEAVMAEQMRQEQSEIEKINRAVEEAVSWKVKELSSESGMTAHWKDGFDKGKAEAYEEVLKPDAYRMNIWKAAQASAYEDAAKIADKVAHELRFVEAMDQGDGMALVTAEEIADAIRARAKEVGDEGWDGVELSGL